MGIGDSVMVNANEIRAMLASFLAKGIDLDKFEDWIAQHTWNVHEFGDPSAVFLAQAIELRLSEHSSGHLSERGLRHELSLLQEIPMIQFGPILVVESGSTNQTSPEPLGQPWQSVDKVGEVVYG
jgi:hypothetical protein